MRSDGNDFDYFPKNRVIVFSAA